MNTDRVLFWLRGALLCAVVAIAAAAFGCGPGIPSSDSMNATPEPVATASEKPAEKAAEPAPEAGEGKLGQADQKLLLTMAREQLVKIVKEGKTVDPRDYPWTITPPLREKGGTFVTLKNAGRLRGCIGDIIPTQAIYESVLANTVNSARRDHRFFDDPITADELPRIEIEITVLTPMKPIASYKDIVIGKHGVLLEVRGRRAVFLPQVAVEQKWDLDTMLRELSMKAGLPANAYKDPAAKFQVFEGQIFNEAEMKGK